MPKEATWQPLAVRHQSADVLNLPRPPLSKLENHEMCRNDRVRMGGIGLNTRKIPCEPRLIQWILGPFTDAHRGLHRDHVV